MAADTFPLDVQALAAWKAAVDYRAGVERHEHLATQRKWNPDLLPAERRHADELDAVAVTMRRLADHAKTRASTQRRALGEGALPLTTEQTSTP